jgi:hypothetical protein
MLIRGALSIILIGSYDPVNLFAKVKFCLNDPLIQKILMQPGNDQLNERGTHLLSLFLMSLLQQFGD